LLNSRIKKVNREVGVLHFDAAFPPPVLGGKEKQAYLLTTHLSQGKLIKVAVLSFYFSKSQNASHESLYVYRIKKSIFYLGELFYQIIKNRNNFSIIHIHTPSRIGKFVAIISKIFFYKVFFKIPNQGLTSMNNIKGILDYLFFNFFVDKIVILENQTKAYFSGFKALRDKILMISNGVKLKKQKIYSKSLEEIKLVYVGRLVEQKGINEILGFSLKLKNINHKFFIDIVGDGPDFNKIRSFILKNNLDKNIRMHGNLKDPFEIMYSSDILLIPSTKEGMSNVILEAMSIGLPIIGTRVGAIEQQVGKEFDKYICNVDQIQEDIYRSYVDLISNNNIEIYGNYLYKRCSSCFDISKIAKEYATEYKKIC
jgi:glycosyltransferase involved in cell wall biosynthesis